MPRDIVALVALVALASLASAPSSALAQVSDPVHHDRVVTGGNNKFLDRQTLPDTHDDDEAARPRDECPANVRLRWMTEVSSSVYATPVIADLHDDGHRQIVVPSFVHHLEVLEGENGARAGGAWPAFHKSTVHASPVVVDTRARGLEIMLPTYDGQVLFFDRDGDATRRRLTLPPLPVKRNWYVHLAPDHVDHSAPDVGAATQEAFASGFGKAEKENGRNGRTARKGSAPRRRRDHRPPFDRRVAVVVRGVRRGRSPTSRRRRPPSLLYPPCHDRCARRRRRRRLWRLERHQAARRVELRHALLSEQPLRLPPELAVVRTFALYCAPQAVAQHRAVALGAGRQGLRWLPLLPLRRVRRKQNRSIQAASAC